MKKKSYCYGIIKENYPFLGRINTLLDNDWKPRRYAYMQKQILSDSSEVVNFIRYSDNLQKLHEQMKDLPSWYNYPLGLCKTMDGKITELK